MKFLNVFTLIFLLAFCFMVPKKVLAEELQAKVIQASSEHLKIKIISPGKFFQKIIDIPKSKIQSTDFSRYHPRDTIILEHNQNADGKDLFIPTDFVRLNPLSWLFFIFIVVVLTVTRWQGLSSLLGMVVSFFIIFKLVLPWILIGQDPIFVSLIASIFIIPTTFYLSHGFNRKTSLAIIGTLFSLAIIGILAKIFVIQAKINGFANEEISFLQLNNPNLIQITNLLIASIIIGALGILDDVTSPPWSILYLGLCRHLTSSSAAFF